MLIRNIQTETGLVNGAIGTIVDIGPISPELSNPSFVFVKFDDPKVGKVLANKQFEQSSVALNPVEHQLFYHGRHIIRRQFPLVLAWASTIHKVQGISIDTAVMDIGSDIFDKGMVYVALSRVRSLKGLF